MIHRTLEILYQIDHSKQDKAKKKIKVFLSRQFCASLNININLSGKKKQSQDSNKHSKMKKNNRRIQINTQKRKQSQDSNKQFKKKGIGIVGF